MNTLLVQAVSAFIKVLRSKSEQEKEDALADFLSIGLEYIVSKSPAPTSVDATTQPS